jgi:hypothetical protein
MPEISEDEQYIGQPDHGCPCDDGMLHQAIGWDGAFKQQLGDLIGAGRGHTVRLLQQLFVGDPELEYSYEVSDAEQRQAILDILRANRHRFAAMLRDGLLALAAFSPYFACTLIGNWEKLHDPSQMLIPALIFWIIFVNFGSCIPYNRNQKRLERWWIDEEIYLSNERIFIGNMLRVIRDLVRGRCLYDEEDARYNNPMQNSVRFPTSHGWGGKKNRRTTI